MADNSNFEKKVKLRLKALEEIGKSDVTVLDTYAGRGLIWKEVCRHWKGTVKVVSIEKEKKKNITALPGDNLKYISNLDLSKFDIIDVDAYGIPFRQLKTIFDRHYNGIIIVTWIQSMYGALPKNLMKMSGITSHMYAKIGSVFF